MSVGAGRRAGVIVAVVLAALSPVAARGQEAPADEAARLREAGRLEGRGALVEAERTLRAVLAERAESVPALLALERVLRIQGRLDELPPLLEAALSEDPGSTVLNTLRLRTWSTLDRVDSLEAAAARWIETSPEIEVPYREAARAWRSRGEYERARRVLEAGRRRIGGDDVLALEIGDIYADLGEPELAVREWARAVAPGGRGGSQIRRRLRSLPDGGSAVVGELVDRLAEDASAAGRLDVALELATEAGLEERAQAVAGIRFGSLEPRERRARLLELALEADGRDLPMLAYWAYRRLLDDAGTHPGGEDASPVVRSRLAALAAELGDTEAVMAPGAGMDAPAAGEAERRRAAATRIDLDAGRDPVAARAALARFREEHPAADELDGLTAAVAEGLIREGRHDEAATLLDHAGGPRSTTLRGRLLLEAGDVEAARAAYLSAAPSLRGAEATAALALATLLGRLSRPGGALIGEALRLRDGDAPGAAVDRLLAGVDELASEDRAPVLDFAARIAATAGLDDESRTIRRRIVEEHPEAPEAPASLLALAREMERDRTTRPRARALLERLILEYPTSALVPQARRALDRLKREGAA